MVLRPEDFDASKRAKFVGLRARSLARRVLGGASIALSLVFASSQAFAGEKEEARRHFKTGMEAISNGQYEKGIKELQQAYEILPHPNVLYNIARAYAESGDLESAVKIYRQYLAGNPPDKEDIETVVRALESRLAKSKAAAAAAAAAANGGGDTGKTGTGDTGKTEPGTGDAGKTGTGDTGKTGTGDTGKTGATGTGDTGKAGAGDTGKATPVGATKTELGSSKEEDVYEEKVVTASKAAQSPLDAPSSTVVITEQDIRLTGITQIPELLRRVAGIDIMQTAPSDYNLSIRGFNQRISNKLLVLVDGRSVYLDFLGTTFWDGLSINVEDIERIEVVKGPGSALYGADAFTGVVNIITRSPGEGKSGVSASVGSQNGAPLGVFRGALWATGRSAGWNYRISSGYDQMPNWSREASDARTDLTYFNKDLNLGSRVIRADARLTRSLAKDVTLGFGGGFTDIGAKVFQGEGALYETAARAVLGDLTGFVTSKNLSFRSFLNFLQADAAQAQNYIGEPAYLTDVRQNVWDNELQYGNEIDIGPTKHDLRVGLGYRLKTIRWSWLSSSDLSENHFNGYLQDSVRIGDKFIVVGSIRGDYVPYLQKVIPSPRGAIIYKRTKDDAIRLSVSSAFRKPSYLESYLDFPVQTPLVGAEVLSQAHRSDNPGFIVQQENVFSTEIGYQNLASDYFAFDVAAYYNRVSNLIVFDNLRPQTPSTVAGGADDYGQARGRYAAFFSGFTNDCQVYNSYGGEVAVRTFPISGLDVYGSYAFNNVDVSAPGGCVKTLSDQRTSHHKITAGAQVRTAVGIDFAADFWYQSSQVWAEQVQNVATQQIQYEQFALGAFAIVNARLGYRFKFAPLDVGVVGFNIFNNIHREHPFGQLIGRRVMLSATYRF